MRQYVTFGTGHRHEVGGKVLNADTVAVFEAADGDAGRAKTFEMFGDKFCFHYTEETFPRENWERFDPEYVEV